MAAIAPVHSGPLNLTVSEIEEADAILRSVKLPRPTRQKAVEGATKETLEPLGETATLVGSLVHRVIERLPRDAKVDSDMIAAGVQSVLKGVSTRSVEPIAAEVMVRRVKALVESELWDEMRRATHCFREIDFLLGWPLGAAVCHRTAVIAGTLDCLLLSPAGEWKILDYKTGRLPEGDPAALREHFAIQLVLYAEAVRAMVGRPPASIEIVALHDELGRFPLVMWEEFRGPVHERIDAAITHLSVLPISRLTLMPASS
jgi:ATP-dependent exoDNAse (exonuclease V) beta subunit